MAINTSLSIPQWQVPNTPESASFLQAYELAKQQHSPLAQMQVQQAQKQIDELGFRIQKEQLDLAATRSARQDELAGRLQAAEMLKLRAQSPDDSDPAVVQQMADGLSKKFTPAGYAIYQDTLNRNQKAREMKQRAMSDAEQLKSQERRTEMIVQGRTAVAEKKGAGTLTPDATEKQALALQRARDRISEAYASGDQDEIDNAELFYSDLKAAQQRQHPDRVTTTQSAMLKIELSAAVKAYYEQGMTPALKANVDRIRAEMKKLDSGTSAPTETVNPPGPAPVQPNFRWDPKTGKVLPVQ